MTYRMTVQYDAPADAGVFDEHYFGRHLPLCRNVPGLGSISTSKPRPLGGDAAPYLVAQLDFADLDAFRTAMRSAEMAEVGHDADGFSAKRVMFTGDVIET